MTSLHPDPAAPLFPRPLRLWPGVVIAALQGLACFFVPIVVPEALPYGVMAGFAGGVGILGWWLFFSRAPWSERVGAVVLMVVAGFVTKRLVHPSIANGLMGMMLPVYAVPLLSLALVVWAVSSRRLSRGLRRAALLGVCVLACGVMTLVRTDGVTGDGVSDLHWRWAPTPEERLLALSPKPPVSPAPASAPVRHAAQWPGFRGPNRDGVVRSARIETNWSASPPVELWRRPVGPGWSSFAVDGTFVYTQEQRGDDELVSCYDLNTGVPVWTHADAARFWESNAGAGPRGTPTLHQSRVYALGATGILNALDARNGTVVWSRNAAADTGRKIPDWGFASSPLVVGDLVIIATANVLAAYELETGNPRWFGPKGGYGYSSPQFAAIAGVAQIVLLNGNGAISVAPSDGRPLWNHAWKGDSIVQPAVLAGGDILLGSGSGLGTKVGVRRVAVTHGSAGWSTEERWTSNALKPYFNDLVVHQGHAYGVDGNTLACLDLTDGQRKWKGGRYGHGQLVVLADQDLLLVLSEKGELALVSATPAAFTELGRFPALEGKTWNHPVLAGDVLLVRNDRGMAAFRLASKSR